jgi:hypothetical protein
MKFCRTVFRAIYAVDPELARRTFTQNASFYHPIARYGARLLPKAHHPLPA